MTLLATATCVSAYVWLCSCSAEELPKLCDCQEELAKRQPEADKLRKRIAKRDKDIQVCGARNVGPGKRRQLVMHICVILFACTCECCVRAHVSVVYVYT